MFTVSDEDRAFLIKHVDNAEKLIDEQNDDELLDEIEYAILREGLDKDGDYNDFGWAIQHIHDRIIDSMPYEEDEE